MTTQSKNIALYLAIIFVWSLSWLPLKYQVASIDPPISVAYRFLAAAILMFAIALIRKEPLKFNFRDHIKFIALGLCIFSTNFVLFYYAAYHLVSGILAIIFATATVMNVINARLWFNTKTNRQTLVGIALGLFGLCLVFLPEIQASASHTPLLGLAFAIGGTFCFSTGNMISLKIQKQDISLISASSWGMLYGGIYMAAIGLIFGMPFHFDTSWTYIASLGYLIIFASIVAFLTYLSLLNAVGPGRAAYTTVVFPIGALLISTFVENYQWTIIAAIGVIIILAGNILILKQKS